MTEKRLRELFSTWQQRLGLEKWVVALEVVPNLPEIDGEPALMRVDRSHFYDRASIVVGGPLLSGDLPDSVDAVILSEVGTDRDAGVEVCVVHELLHLACRDMMQAGDLVREQLAPAAVLVWDSAWRRAEEAAVERLAVALVGAWSSAR